MSEPSRMIFTVLSEKSMRGIGLGISVADGSSGARNSPQGCIGVAEGGEVGVTVAVGSGVDVGRRGIKGVGETVARGSAVTTGPLKYDISGRPASVILLHDARPSANSEMAAFFVRLIIKALNMYWTVLAFIA